MRRVWLCSYALAGPSVSVRSFVRPWQSTDIPEFAAYAWQDEAKSIRRAARVWGSGASPSTPGRVPR